MNLHTIVTKRPKLSLHYGGMTARPSTERHHFPTGTLSTLELRRIVSEMVG